MLINIDPILNPELLFHLRAMGHGDSLVLADANFPSYSINSNVIRLDGVNIGRAAKAILSVFPLDSFVEFPVAKMEIDKRPEEENEVQKEFSDVLKNSSEHTWNMGSICRQDFYREAEKAYCVVATTDTRPYGCFILTKGVLDSTGKVYFHK